MTKDFMKYAAKYILRKLSLIISSLCFMTTIIGTCAVIYFIWWIALGQPDISTTNNKPPFVLICIIGGLIGILIFWVCISEFHKQGSKLAETTSNKYVISEVYRNAEIINVPAEGKTLRFKTFSVPQSALELYPRQLHETDPIKSFRRERIDCEDGTIMRQLYVTTESGYTYLFINPSL